MKWVQWICRMGLVLLLNSVLADSLHAQEANLSMRVEPNETLANSQSINVQSLLANNGKGPNLFQLYLNNNDQKKYANNLFFEIIVRSDKIGKIAHLEQVPGQPFSLSPGQQVFANNNSIGNGLPGVEELIQFDGDLTPEGRKFVNDLEGATNLPADRYSVEINVYQGRGKARRVASSSASVGAAIVEDVRDFYLLAPGDVVDANATIANPYPHFQWQGANGSSYRLIVVEGKDNESPQSLVDGAASTAPVQLKGSASSGSLLDYEMLDVVINRSNFQFPHAGVQKLETGKTYYWRVISELNTSSGRQGRESEIWSFTLAGSGKGRVAASSRQGARVSRALQMVLGDQFRKYNEQGYFFRGIEIEGRRLQGGQAMQKLIELGRRAERGEISIVIEGQ